VFQAQFDRIALMLSLAFIMILFYFGLAIPNFVKDYWVAFGFWIVGFFGSILTGITKRTVALSLSNVIVTGGMIGLLILVFAGLNIVYGTVQAQEIMFGQKLLSFAVGIAEELFFGIFCLGFVINWLRFPSVLAIFVVSGGHALYHVPNWGANPPLLMLFFTCFVMARSLYVFVFPKAGMLLGSHGVWNLGVG